MERALFYIFGLLAVAASVSMVTRRSPLASALSLVVALVSLAALYALLDAHLLFAIQLWVYAGAVMVLVIFVIILLNLRQEDAGGSLGLGRFSIGALAVGAVAWQVLSVLGGVRGGPLPEPPGFGTVAGVSELLFSRYILQFEVVSVLLLAVIVAVVVLAKKRF
jgi:NADH-quinone oxidoreductase subunit J